MDNKIIWIHAKAEWIRTEQLNTYKHQLSQIIEEVKRIVDNTLDNYLKEILPTLKIQIWKILREYKTDSQENYEQYTIFLYGIIALMVADFPHKVQLSNEDFHIIIQDILWSIFLSECRDFTQGYWTDLYIKTQKETPIPPKKYENVIEEIRWLNLPRILYDTINQKHIQSGRKISFQLLRDNYEYYRRWVFIIDLSWEMFEYFWEEDIQFSDEEVRNFMKKIIDIHKTSIETNV